MKRILISYVAFLLMFFATDLPCASAQGGTPIFQRRYIPPAGEPPPRENIPEREPIPQGWTIGIEAVLAFLGLVVLIAAARAWHESNIFGRQYRFRADEPAARRLGGTRSGGFMAVIEPTKDENA